MNGSAKIMEGYAIDQLAKHELVNTFIDIGNGTKIQALPHISTQDGDANMINTMTTVPTVDINRNPRHFTCSALQPCKLVDNKILYPSVYSYIYGAIQIADGDENLLEYLLSIITNCLLEDDHQDCEFLKICSKIPMTEKKKEALEKSLDYVWENRDQIKHPTHHFQLCESFFRVKAKFNPKDLDFKESGQGRNDLAILNFNNGVLINIELMSKLGIELSETSKEKLHTHYDERMKDKERKEEIPTKIKRAKGSKTLNRLQSKDNATLHNDYFYKDDKKEKLILER